MQGMAVPRRAAQCEPMFLLFSKGISQMSGSIVQVSVEIEGVTPLLCNRFTDSAAQAATAGTRGSAVGDRGTPREQAEQKLYLSHDGETLIIPSMNLFRSIMDAGTFFKAGKSKVTTQKSSMIPACLSIEQIEIPIQHAEPWDVDSRAVRIPSTGGRILAHRPCFNDWKLAFDLKLDSSILGIKLLREIVDAAGSRIGLGDFRPATKGPFGRYSVTLWAVDSESNGKVMGKGRLAGVR